MYEVYAILRKSMQFLQYYVISPVMKSKRKSQLVKISKLMQVIGNKLREGWLTCQVIVCLEYYN